MIHVIEHFKINVQKQPLAPALLIDESSFSYAELDYQSAKFAESLINRGLQKGDVVAIHGINEPWIVFIIFAVWKARGVICLIDTSLPQERKEVMVSEANVKFIVENDHCLLTKHDVIRVNDLKLLSNLKHHKADHAKHVFEYDLNDNAYIFFTSGSTGNPKGVLAKHLGLAHFLNWQKDEFQLSEEDSCYQITKISFDVFLRSVFTPLISGASVVFPNAQLAITDVKIIEEMSLKKVTFFHCVPTLFDIWLSQLNSSVNMPELKYIFFAGEKLSEELIVKSRKKIFHNAEYVNLYGPSETVLAKFYYRFTNIIENRDIPVGQGIPETEAYILDSKKNICDVNQTGEVVIATPYKGEGYISKQLAFKNLPKVLNSKHKQGYYTGDLGFIDSSGLLHISGRINDEIKVNGVKVNLLEVENIISSSEHVSRAICYYNDSLKALEVYLMLEGNFSRKKIESIYQYMENFLLVEMIPSKIYRVKEFIYTGSGKIDRKRTASLSKKNEITLLDDNFQDFSATDKLIFNLIKSEFNITPEYDVSLFRYGINSLKLTLLLAKLSQRLAINIKLSDFSVPTLANISKIVDRYLLNQKEPIQDNLRTVQTTNHLRLSPPQQSIYNF